MYLIIILFDNWKKIENEFRIFQAFSTFDVTASMNGVDVSCKGRAKILIIQIFSSLPRNCIFIGSFVSVSSIILLLLTKLLLTISFVSFSVNSKVKNKISLHLASLRPYVVATTKKRTSSSNSVYAILNNIVHNIWTFECWDLRIVRSMSEPNYWFSVSYQVKQGTINLLKSKRCHILSRWFTLSWLYF